MASMKKYMAFGMIAVALLASIVLIIAALSGDDVIINTNNTTIDDVDGVLQSFSKINHPEVVDDRIFIEIDQTGDENLEFSVASLAVHNVYFDQWFVLNEEKTWITEERFFKRTLADTDLIYNDVYIWIPEVKYNGTEIEMPENKFYIPGDFIELEENQNAFLRITVLKDESVFEKEDGSLIFAPKMLIESWKGMNLIVNENEITPEFGTLWTNITVGMDNKGKVHSGLVYIE